MFDFVTSIWPGAQRGPANLPPAMLPMPAEDDPWTNAGRSPAKPRKGSGKRKTKAQQPPPPPIDGDDAVILALIKTCRERGQWKLLSVTELADAMAVSIGEASKRVKVASEGERLVWAQKSGRKKMVGLHRLSTEQWQEINAGTPGQAVNRYRVFVARTRQGRAAHSVGAESGAAKA